MGAGTIQVRVHAQQITKSWVRVRTKFHDLTVCVYQCEMNRAPLNFTVNGRTLLHYEEVPSVSVTDMCLQETLRKRTAKTQRCKSSLPLRI